MSGPETPSEPGRGAQHAGQVIRGEPGRVILGDNLAALQRLVAAGERAKFVYLDPPFASKTDYRSRILTRLADETPVSLELPAYADRWADLDAYLAMLRARLVLVHRLLADDGAVCVHVDWHAAHRVRVLLDDVFGASNFVNAIVWAYRSGGASRTRAIPRKHDDLLLYRRGPGFRVHPLVERQYLERPFMGSQRDAQGRFYVDTLLRDVLEGEVTLVTSGRSDGVEPNAAAGYADEAPQDAAARQQADAARDTGLGAQADAAPNAGVELLAMAAQDADLSARAAAAHGPEPTDGSTERLERVNLRPVLNVSRERTGYATQKPRGLLEVLLRWCTDAGDLVVDPFGGSGTTALAAAHLGRRWVSIDANPHAVAVTRARLDAADHDYTLDAPIDPADADVVLELGGQDAGATFAREPGGQDAGRGARIPGVALRLVRASFAADAGEADLQPDGAVNAVAADPLAAVAGWGLYRGAERIAAAWRDRQGRLETRLELPAAPGAGASILVTDLAGRITELPVQR